MLIFTEMPAGFMLDGKPVATIVLVAPGHELSGILVAVVLLSVVAGPTTLEIRAA